MVSDLQQVPVEATAGVEVQPMSLGVPGGGATSPAVGPAVDSCAAPKLHVYGVQTNTRSVVQVSFIYGTQSLAAIRLQFPGPADGLSILGTCANTTLTLVDVAGARAIVPGTGADLGKWVSKSNYPALGPSPSSSAATPRLSADFPPTGFLAIHQPPPSAEQGHSGTGSSWSRVVQGSSSATQSLLFFPAAPTEGDVIIKPPSDLLRKGNSL